MAKLIKDHFLHFIFDSLILKTILQITFYLQLVILAMALSLDFTGTIMFL